MNAMDVSERLGGARILGHEIFSELDWIEVLEHGLPHESVDAAIEHGLLSREESEALVIPRRTLTHRRQKHQRLSLEESDRLLRIARVSARAEEAFGDAGKAHRWLRKPSRPLRGAVPLELLKTSAGAELVQEELVRIEHGIYL
ncbi:MAG TPA: antitoxin Xre/MbcA/ParS toxin-binding domain-containing protein [Longimicrobiales bacterium]|nr:antitoxin Xre/MbcA/ParS toxin-binding domain-containing protein [Longimicrobiales bacterium]